jgi:hypothetical protein
MFCAQCGKEIPAGSPTCPACGFNAMPSGPARSDRPSFEAAVAEMRQAAKELTRSAQALSRQVAKEARKAAHDPTGSARRASRKAAQELNKVAEEVERVLRDL